MCKNTAEIGLFKIAFESGIGAGTRRIEALTGQYAFELLNQSEKTLEDIAGKLKASVDNVPQKIEQMMIQIRDLEKENESLSAKLSNAAANDLTGQIQTIDGVPVIAKQLEGQDMETLRQMIDQLKNEMAEGIIVLATVKDNKVQLAAGITSNLVDRGLPCRETD